MCICTHLYIYIGITHIHIWVDEYIGRQITLYSGILSFLIEKEIDNSTDGDRQCYIILRLNGKYSFLTAVL